MRKESTQTTCDWQLKHKYECWWKHFPAFQADFLSQGPIWYKADSLCDLICICFSCHLWCPLESVSGLYGDRVVTLPNADAIQAPEGPPWATISPQTQINHWRIHSANEFSPPVKDNFRCYETVDDLCGQRTLTEYLWGVEGQYCYKGIRQPSLMLITLFKQQLKSNTMLQPWQMWGV